MNKNQMLLESIYLRDDLNVIQEGFGDLIKKFNDNKKVEEFINKLKNVKDVDSFKRITSFVPKMGFNQVEEIAKKKVDNYEKNKAVVNKLLNKKIPVKYREPISSIISISSKDNKSMGEMINKVNKEEIDWHTANVRAIFNIFFSIGFASGWTILAPLIIGAPVSANYFMLVLSLFLIIDLIFYLIDLASLRIEA